VGIGNHYISAKKRSILIKTGKGYPVEKYLHPPWVKIGEDCVSTNPLFQKLYASGKTFAQLKPCFMGPSLVLIQKMVNIFLTFENR
jgi:hypothetical protein